LNQFLVAINQVHDLGKRKETDAKRKWEIGYQSFVLGKSRNDAEEKMNVLEQAQIGDIQAESHLQSSFPHRTGRSPYPLANDPIG
jgi:hypothetical protein